MGSKLGALKIAAGRLGITFEEYRGKVASGLKWCYRCKQWKPTADFNIDRSRGDGLSAKCYECQRENIVGPSKRERQAKLSDGLKWCCGCQKWFPVDQVRGARCRLCRNAYARSRYATDTEYREERKNHRDKHRRGAERVPPEGREILLESSEGMCVYCRDVATTWDHIFPVSKGGQTTPGNIVPCCISCNSSKKDREVFDWIDEKGLSPLPLLCERMELSVLE